MASAIAIIHEERGAFGISFPDFPGCISTGTSLDEVLRKGTEALNFHVAGMVEDGDPLPAPRDLADLRDDAAFQEDAAGGLLAVVSYDVPGRAVRLNISMPENLVAAVDRAAEQAGQSRSAYLADAARARLKGAA